VCEEEKPKISLSILAAIKEAQLQNGLRHGDHARYRQFCARKLRRLRRGKQIKLTHGRGRNFVPKSVTADIVSVDRLKFFPIINANDFAGI
jgi:signal recognition particle subunit SRP68